VHTYIHYYICTKFSTGNYYYNHFTDHWTLSGTTWMSQYQKGKTRKAKPIWIYFKTNLDLLEQETVSGSGISWAICSFYRLDALPAAQLTASKHWRHM